VFGVVPHGTTASAAEKRNPKIPINQGRPAIIPARTNPALTTRLTIVAARLISVKRLVL
jgi:hypothetical protein